MLNFRIDPRSHELCESIFNRIRIIYRSIQRDHRMQEARVCVQFERDRARVNVRLAVRKHTGYALGKFYFSVADACRDMPLMYVYSVHCISVVYI